MNWFFERIDPFVMWLDEYDVVYHIGRFLKIFCLILCPIPVIVGFVNNDIAFVLGGCIVALIGVVGGCVSYLFEPQLRYIPEPTEKPTEEFNIFW